MNYIGSKHSLIDFLLESIRGILLEYGDKRSPEQLYFSDLFAGTGVVAAAFKTAGYNVIANDLQYYSYVLCQHLVGGGDTLTRPRALDLCRMLEENAPCVEGFLYENYSYGGSRQGAHPRQYFSDYNAAKCDGMRLLLERLLASGAVSQEEYFFLLASLLDSVDRYANTASVYGAFLKTLKKSAAREMELSPLPIVHGRAEYYVFNADALDLIDDLAGDVLYLDPPYNFRQYSANYHILETIARYDAPKIKGKTGLRTDLQKSGFCSGKRVSRLFEELIRRANYRYIFVSYNNEGLMPLEEIRAIMSRYGEYSVRTKTYRRFKADSDGNRRHKELSNTTEYLHILVKPIARGVY